ncbi:unnamed protein product [Urochloa humidicola]
MDGQDQEEDWTFDSLVKDMKVKLSRPPAPEAPPRPAYFISCVDEQIRNANPGEYTPFDIPIGPIHRNSSHWMQQRKMDLLYSALPGTSEQQREQALRQYLEAVADLEVRARHYYQDTFKRISSEAFACMMLLDGFFVLSCFGLTGSTRGDADGQAVLLQEKFNFDVFKRDVIFLLENQVPFFVLEGIYRLVLTNGDNSNSSAAVVQEIARQIEELVVHSNILHSTVTFRTVVANLRGESPCHLLHLLYVYFQQPTVNDQPRCSGTAQTNGPLTPAHVALTVVKSPVKDNKNASTDEDDKHTIMPRPRWRSATYYYAAGVRFAKRELDGEEARSILDVDLRGDTLRVPYLMVDAKMTTILRNMVALEQHNPGKGDHVAAYCFFLSQLASTEEDVKLLSNKGIIEHCLSNDSTVADEFAGLCIGVQLNLSNPDSYLRWIQEDLEKLSKSPWRKSMAWLRHSKCNNVLMALAVLGAVILFLCTVEQSVFAALGYAKGRS